MGLYTNINNVQKELMSLNVNIGNSQKNISAAYANIDGTQKQIFEAKKYYWWKAYPVTSWEQVKSYNNYNNNTDDDDVYIEYICDAKGGYKTCTLQSNGQFLLSDYFTFTWSDKTIDESSYGTTTSWSTAERDFYLDWWAWYSHTSSQYLSSYPVYFSISLGSSQMESDSFFGGYTVGRIDYGLYAQPTAHSSNYKLIKCNNYYKGYVPYIGGGIQSDGTYQANYAYYLFNYDGNDSNAGIGYAFSRNYDDHGDIQRYYFDGYYWEYLGYYA